MMRILQKKGDDILSHITAVPSAQAGLTTLFGMGRGEPRRNNHLKVVFAMGNQINWSTLHNILTYWDKEKYFYLVFLESFFLRLASEEKGVHKLTDY